MSMRTNGVKPELHNP